jgi:hypothetical protein
MIISVGYFIVWLCFLITKPWTEYFGPKKRITDILHFFQVRENVLNIQYYMYSQFFNKYTYMF